MSLQEELKEHFNSHYAGTYLFMSAINYTITELEGSLFWSEFNKHLELISPFRSVPTVSIRELDDSDQVAIDVKTGKRFMTMIMGKKNNSYSILGSSVN